MVDKYKTYISESCLNKKFNIAEYEEDLHKENFESLVPDITLAGINKIIGSNYTIINEAKSINPYMQLICTGSKNKAAEAWVYGCNSYIMKPFKKEHLLKSLGSQIIRIEQIRLYNKHTKTLAIKCGGKWERLLYKDIIYFEKVGKKVNIVKKFGKCSFYSSFESLRKTIDMNYFFQCHQGYIINRYRMKTFKDNFITLEGAEVSIPVSRRLRKETVELFEKLYNLEASKRLYFQYR